MKNSRFKSNWKSVGVSVFLVALLVLTISISNQDDARAQVDLGNASLSGAYAAFSPAEVRATINGSILSYLLFDGEGGWRSSSIRNTITSDLQRNVEPLSGLGSYELRSDGIGAATSTTVNLDGTFSQADFDFIVTHVEDRDGAKVVTEFFALPRLSSTGKPSGVIFKRHPDNANFEQNSVLGSYAVSYFVGENESAGIGVFTFDGTGFYFGELISNTAQEATTATQFSCAFPCLIGDGEEENRLITFSAISGSIDPSPDGFGTMSLELPIDNETSIDLNFDMLVTQAEEGTHLVTELIALQQEPEGDAGGLRSLVLTRISD